MLNVAAALKNALIAGTATTVAETRAVTCIFVVFTCPRVLDRVILWCILAKPVD